MLFTNICRTLGTATNRHRNCHETDTGAFVAVLYFLRMRKIAIILWVCLFSTISYASVGAKRHVRFDHFSTEDGLSSNLIFSMSQDPSGFLWLGTDFGLDRFDGKLFKHFRKDKYPNMQREDLNSIEEARGMEEMMTAFGLNQSPRDILEVLCVRAKADRAAVARRFEHILSVDQAK